MIALNLQTRPALASDYQSLSNLVFFESHVHRHLDWRSPLDWLGRPFYWVIEENGRIAAALACPTDPRDVAWIRLFVHDARLPLREAWDMLWAVAQDTIRAAGGATVAAIVMQRWLEPSLRESGFANLQDIVMLEWNSRPLAPSLPVEGVIIRPMTTADLPAVAETDADAFAPLWHNSFESLGRAFGQSLYATVAEMDGRMAGYQLSTGHAAGAHLARLAVRKEAQGRRIGAALVWDLMSFLRRRNLARLTVNTQNDNHASLALYRRMGFLRTGEQFPVFTFPVGG
ncbi:MAG: GNAT family N-acetyltransferase [Chloroflexota bacterium]